MPRGCLGLPVYAALYQGIPMVAVGDNVVSKTCTEVIRKLPWGKNQYIEVANYKEALGVLAAMKAGVSVESISRPLETKFLNPGN